MKQDQEPEGTFMKFIRILLMILVLVVFVILFFGEYIFRLGWW